MPEAMETHPFSCYSKTLYKIVIIGNASVGKTSILQRFVKGTFQDYKCTIGTDILIKKLSCDDREFTLQLWDTSGSERYRTVNSLYYRGSDACLLVFDTSDEDSFKSLNFWKHDFLIHTNPTRADRFPLVLMGNKVDIPERVVQKASAEEWSAKYNIPYVETSAKDDLNIEEAFQILLKQILTYEEEEEVVPDPLPIISTIHLNSTGSLETKNGCC